MTPIESAGLEGRTLESGGLQGQSLDAAGSLETAAEFGHEGLVSSATLARSKMSFASMLESFLKESGGPGE